MSLYVGHLSPSVHQEELERVFRRFGRCNVRLKDRYGFVVYENITDAERALRSLKGKNICGENIVLNWANKQPSHIQRSANISGHQEPIKRRIMREDNGVRFVDSLSLRNFRSASCSAAHKQKEHQLDEKLHKESSETPEDIIDIEGYKDMNLEGGSKEGITTEINQEDNGRWGQHSNDTTNGRTLDDASDFDRYEPYHGYGRDDDENPETDVTYHPQDRKNSEEKKRWTEKSLDDTVRNADKSECQQVCYNCKQIGHLMRNCPTADRQREKISSFREKQKESNIRGRREGRLKRYRVDSPGTGDANKDPVMSMHHRQNRKGYNSKRNIGADSRIANFPLRKERYKSKFRAGSPVKRKVECPSGDPKTDSRRGRARDSTSASSRSPSTVSRSKSRLKRSGSEYSSPSRVRRVSSISQSSFSSSTSSSISSHSKSVSSRSVSKSQSLSMPTSISLSVSLERKTERSPKLCHRDTDSVASSKKVASLEPSVRLETNSLVLRDDCQGALFNLNADPTEEYPENNVNNSNITNVKIEGNESYSCIDLHREVSAHENHEGKAQHENSPLMVKRNITTKCETVKPTSLGMEELFSVLKRYGFATPAERQPSMTVGEYFGAARLWPWEIIYYRRMKKGPISTENYARRVEQNKEFGIVDKYIRSSSGWGEQNEDDYT